MTPPLHRLEGTWALVSFAYGEGGSVTKPVPGVRKIKLLTPDRFSWVEFDERSGRVLASVGGTYRIEGTKYIETIEYTLRAMAGGIRKQQVFEMSFEQGRLHLNGRLTNGQPIDEVWELVPAPGT